MRGATTGGSRVAEWKVVVSFERATTMRPIFASKLLTRMDGNPFDNCRNIRFSNRLLNVAENMHVLLG